MPRSPTYTAPAIPINLTQNPLRISGRRTDRPRFINRSTKIIWKGLDKGDDKYRIYQYIPDYLPGKIRRRYRRGKLMSSFTRSQLIRVAWKVGVTNPEGFDLSDCEFLNTAKSEGFKIFNKGWNNTIKVVLMDYIWNKLYDLDRIDTD